MSLFVYWRVRAEDAASAESAVQAWQADLMARAPGLQASLWRREEAERPGQVTLMEVYADVPAALESELAAGAVLADWQQGPRHVERFVRVVRPAGA